MMDNKRAKTDAEVARVKKNSVAWNTPLGDILNGVGYIAGAIGGAVDHGIKKIAGPPCDGWTEYTPSDPNDKTVKSNAAFCKTRKDGLDTRKCPEGWEEASVKQKVNGIEFPSMHMSGARVQCICK